MANHYNVCSGGAVHKAIPVGAYGKIVTAGAQANTLLWPDGTFVIPTTAGLSMTIQSTSANDAAAGTGIRTVEVHYLDVDLNEAAEVVTLNGTTSVGLSYANIRFIQCTHALTVGSGGVAAGDITVTSGGQTYGEIATGELRCASSARMVPKNKIYYVQGLSGGSTSGSAAASVLIKFAATMIDSNILTSEGIFMPMAGIAVQDNSAAYTVPIALPFPEGVVIAMTASSDKAATITGSWYGWEEPASN